MLHRVRGLLTAPAEGRRETPAEILYALEQRPPLPVLLGAGVQHAAVALMFTLYAVLTARGAGLGPVAASGFLGLTIVIMGAITLLQSAPTRFGGGRLLVQIPNPISLGAFVAIAQTHGLGAAGGGFLVAAVAVQIVGRGLPRLRALLPPEISGVVVFLVGVELVSGGAGRFLGHSRETGIDPMATAIALTCLAGIVGLSVWGRGQVKVFAILGGVVGGLTVALVGTDFAATVSHALAGQPLFALPGTGFDIPTPTLVISAAIPLVVIELLSLLDLVGTSIAIDRMDNSAWRRPDMRMIGRCITAQSVSLALNGLTGTLSGATSSANLGAAHASGITARRVGMVAGMMLIAAAFLPALPTFLVLLPDPVIGAMMIYAAGYMMVAGTELILSRMLNARRTFVVGLGLVVGIAVLIHPELVARAPEAVRPILASGLASGSVAAILLNLLFRIGMRQRAAVDLRGADMQGQATRFLELQGGDWGARRDVATRAGIAVGEALEALPVTAGAAVELAARFDEFNLDIDLAYDGPPLSLVRTAEAHTSEALEAVLDADDDAGLDAIAAGLSNTLITRLADRVRTSTRDGRSVLTLHFDH